MELLQFARSRRGGELIGIVILAAGTCLALALLTYHPDDSSAFYTSTNSVVANWIGYYGATIAWLFVGFFGFASLLFPGALLVVGWNRIAGREIEYLQTKAIGFVILVIAAPPLCDLAFGKVWLRGALIPSGGYLGQELNHAASTNLNGIGAAIVLVTMMLIGLLLATRISLAAIFVALHQKLAGIGRAFSLQWARFTERRRKEKMKTAIVRKHLDKEAPGLRLVANDNGSPLPAAGPIVREIVREVKGAGRFQIRKVTKADLRKAAEELSKQETPDPFALWAAAKADTVEAAQFSRPVAVEDDGEFEDPLYLDDPPAVRAPRPKAQMPRPVPRKQKEAPPKRETRLTHDLLPPVDLLTAGPKVDMVNDDVHKKFLDIGHLIEERCREFS